MNKTRGKKRAYPGLAAVLLRSMITGSSAQRDQKVADADLCLDLDLRGVGMLEFDVVAPVVEAGYQAAHERIKDWLAAEANSEVEVGPADCVRTEWRSRQRPKPFAPGHTK